MTAVSENLWLFKVTFSFGISQKSHEAKSDGWSNFVSDFGQKLLYGWSIMSRGIVMIQDPSIRVNFRSSLRTSSSNCQYMKMTMLVHSLILFRRFEANNVLLI
jgi:hypothetical protein